MVRRKKGGDTKPPFTSPFSLLDREPEASLDLHGSLASQVAQQVESFLKRQRSGTIVHVITGRGKGSAGKAVLRPRVQALLGGQLKPLVADFVKDLDEGGFIVRRA